MSGIPQGSVLGPLLFVIYINKVISTISEDSKVNMFADDNRLYRILTFDIIMFKYTIITALK